MSSFRKPPRCHKQSGVMLLEALIGLLIFSIGILAMIGMQAISIKNSASATYRSEASYLANQIISQMWASVLRNADGTINEADFATYALNSADATCTVGANATGGVNANVVNWLGSDVSRLPQPHTGALRQIITTTAGTHDVTVTLCWGEWNDVTKTVVKHNFVATAQIN